MQHISSTLNTSLENRYGLLKAKMKGFTKVPNLFLARQDISIFEKMIWIILKKHQMNKTMCWPSMKTIGEEARCSETVVKQTIKKLESKGLITKSKIKGFKSNVYEVKNI